MPRRVDPNIRELEYACRCQDFYESLPPSSSRLIVFIRDDRLYAFGPDAAIVARAVGEPIWAASMEREPDSPWIFSIDYTRMTIGEQLRIRNELSNKYTLHIIRNH